MSISMSTSIIALLPPGIDLKHSFSKPLESEKTSPEAEFLKEAKKTPAERIRAAVLKKLGITEEDLAAMDPATRAAIEKIIRQEIEQKLKANAEKATGSLADLSV